MLSKTALTQGQWCVHDKIWYDEKNRFVYFHGYREDPLENHLYVVSLDQPLNVVRLTDLGCSHSVQINTVSSAENYINQIKYLGEIMGPRLSCTGLFYLYFKLFVLRIHHNWPTVYSKTTA